VRTAVGVVASLLITLLAPPAQANASAPEAPSDLVATVVSATAVDLTWTDNSDNENGFGVLRCQGSADCFDFGEIKTLGRDVRSYQDTGLVPGTTYRYLVRAFNTEGNRYSNDAVVTTPQIPPSAPSELAAAAGKHGFLNWVDLSWRDGSNNEAAFVIERCAGSGCADFTAIATVAANVTTYRDAAVGRRTVYRYRISATNSAGESGYSNVAAVTTR
jgi:titin